MYSELDPTLSLTVADDKRVDISFETIMAIEKNEDIARNISAAQAKYKSELYALKRKFNMRFIKMERKKVEVDSRASRLLDAARRIGTLNLFASIESDDEDCSLCCEKKEGFVLSLHCCKHSFHTRDMCLSILLSSNKCPLCRASYVVK